MKKRIVLLVTLAGCMGMPALVEARPPDDARQGHDQGRAVQGEMKHPNEAKAVPTAGPPPAATVGRPSDQEWKAHLEEHMRQTQDAARAARKASRKDAKSWNDGRSLRAETHRRDVAQALGNLANTAEAKAELATHADRMARLNRILDLAEDQGNNAVVSRANELVRRELERNARAIAAIKAKAGMP